MHSIAELVIQQAAVISLMWLARWRHSLKMDRLSWGNLQPVLWLPLLLSSPT